MCFGTLLVLSFLSSQSSQSRIWHIFTMQKLAVAKTSTVLVWIIALSHSLCFLFHCSMHICTVGFNMFLFSRELSLSLIIIIIIIIRPLKTSSQKRKGGREFIACHTQFLVWYSLSVACVCSVWRSFSETIFVDSQETFSSFLLFFASFSFFSRLFCPRQRFSVIFSRSV